MPCAFSRIEISTVTPVTMMITRHGILLIASPSSAHLASTRTTEPAKAAKPTFSSKKMTPTSTAAMTASVATMPPVERLVGLRGREKRVSIHDRRRRAAAREQLQPAEQEIAAERDRGVREQVGQVGLRREAAHADPRHQPVDDDPGRRERRQRSGVRAVARP